MKISLGDETAYFDLSNMSSTVKTPTKPVSVSFTFIEVNKKR